jgi:WD40 repeat protein
MLVPVLIWFPFPIGFTAIGGASDGSIQIWNTQNKKTFSAPDILLRPGHTVGTSVTTVTVSHNNQFLVSRGDDHTIRIWDLKQKKSSFSAPKTCVAPLHVIESVFNVYASANIAFR